MSQFSSKLFLSLLIFLIGSVYDANARVSYDCRAAVCKHPEEFAKCIARDDFLPQEHPNCMATVIDAVLNEEWEWTEDFENLFVKKAGHASGLYHSPKVASKRDAMRLAGSGYRKNWRKDWVLKDKTRPVRILVVDGGGIRGLIPALLIEDMEKQLGKPLTEVFDIFVGTSTGGLISIMLNIRDPKTKRPFTGERVVRFYKEMGKTIFTNPVHRQIRTLGGLVGAKYSVKPFEKLLSEYLTKPKNKGRLWPQAIVPNEPNKSFILLSETVKPVVTTSFDLKTKSIFLFSSDLADQDPTDYNLSLFAAARGTTAAPIYFKPYVLKLPNGLSMTLTDGGVAANNPGLVALLEAMKIYPGREYVIVSLGTGEELKLQTPQARGSHAGGVISMLTPTIEALFKGPNDLTEQTLAGLSKKGDYFRINPKVSRLQSELDDASNENLAKLEKIAQSVIRGDSPNMGYRNVYQDMIARIRSILSIEKPSITRQDPVSSRAYRI